MDPLDVIRRESDTFYDVAARADPARPVPACPDWNLADLTWHLAEVHWFWATIVEHRLQDPSEAEDRKPARPDGHDAVVELGRAGADHLLRVLAGADDATAVWTWADRQDVGFIRRHQVQEACVHRWDMQRSAGDDTPDPIGADAAVDSIDEFVEISLPWCVNPDKPLPGSVHLHCHDADGEWFVHPDGRVESIHAKGDVAVRGTASDLLLALYGRIDAGELELLGDESLGRRFFASIDVG